MIGRGAQAAARRPRPRRAAGRDEPGRAAGRDRPPLRDGGAPVPSAPRRRGANLDRLECPAPAGRVLAGGDHFLAEYFAREIFPVLTPIALDPAIPSRTCATVAEPGGAIRRPRRQERACATAWCPSERVAAAGGKWPDGRRTYVLLEDVIARHVRPLFPGMPSRAAGRFASPATGTFPSTRRSRGPPGHIEREVRSATAGARCAWRSPRRQTAPPRVPGARAEAGRLDVYRIDVRSTSGSAAAARTHRPEGAATTSRSRRSPTGVGDGERDFFRLIREKDVLLHHPYESSDLVVSFIEPRRRPRRARRSR